jgi:hypothetical protein
MQRMGVLRDEGVRRVRVFGASHVQHLGGVVDLVVGILQPHLVVPVATLEPVDRTLEEGAGDQSLDRDLAPVQRLP